MEDVNCKSTHCNVHNKRWICLSTTNGVGSLTESDEQFHTRASAADDCSPTTSSQHDNGGKVSPPQAENKLSARITVPQCLCSVKFQLCCSSSPPRLHLFLTIFPDQRWKFTHWESLVSFLSPTSVFAPSSPTVLPSLTPPTAPPLPVKVCSSSPTRCGGNN